jgi:hypothetical protein
MKRIEAIGKVELGFRLGVQPMKHNFLVFANLPYDIILGTEFIFSKGLQLDLLTGVVHTKNPQADTPLYSNAFNAQRQAQGEQMYPLYAKEDTVILPFQRRWVVSGLPATSETARTGIVHADPIHQDNILVKGGVVEKLPGTDDIPVHVTNCDAIDFTIPAGFKIGSWLPLSSQQLENMGALSDRVAEIEKEIKKETRDYVSKELSLAIEVYEDTAVNLLSLAPDNSEEDEFWTNEDYLSAPRSAT